MIKGSAGTKDEAQRRPDITVIVPVWNRVEIVGRCLDALERQETSNTAFEVVVVDDGSEDGTDKLLAEYGGKGKLDLRVTKHRSHRNLAAARNTGLTHARGPIVLFLDADIVAKPDVVEIHANYHCQYPDSNVAILGNVSLPEEWPLTPLTEMGNAAVMWRDLKPGKELPWWNFFGGHISAKRNFILSVSGFDERVQRCQDIELGRRLMPMGLKIIYASEAVGFHYHLRTPEKWGENTAVYGKQLARLCNSGDPAWREFVSYSGYLDKGVKASTKRAIGSLVGNRMVSPAALWAANVLKDRFCGISVLLCRALRYHAWHTAFKLEVKRPEPDE